MKRHIVLALMLVVLAAFCPLIEAYGTPEGALRVGTESSFPPFVFRDDSGGLEGFEIDLAKAVASELDREVIFIDMAFDALLPALSAGRIDMIAAGLSITPERLKRAYFSKPYFFSRDAVVVRKGEAGPSDTDWFKGRRVTVQARTIQDDHLTSMGGVDIIRYQRSGEALRAVLEGKADAAFMDGVSAERFLVDDHSLGEGLKVALSGQITSGAMGLAVRKIDGELLEKVNSALEALSAEGHLDQLREKWFGEI